MSSINSITHSFSEYKNEFFYYLNVFYCNNLEKNGKLEGVANWALQPLRCVLTSFQGRKIINLTEVSYQIKKEENFFDEYFLESKDKILIDAVLLVASLVFGTVLKIISWVFVQGVFDKNRQFVKILKTELKREQQWYKNVELYKNCQRKASQQKRIDDTEASLIDLNIDALSVVFSYLEQKDLDKVRKVSSKCYLGVWQADVIAHQPQRKKEVEINFSKDFLAKVKGFNQLSRAPKMRLPVHRINDNPDDYQLQRYGDARVSNYINFLSSKEMNDFPIRWGIHPLPFIAINTIYEANDTSLLSRIAYKLGLKKTLLIEKEGVITLNIVKKEQIDRENESIEKQTWALHLPWSFDSVDCDKMFDLYPEQYNDKEPSLNSLAQSIFDSLNSIFDPTFFQNRVSEWPKVIRIKENSKKAASLKN